MSKYKDDRIRADFEKLKSTSPDIEEIILLSYDGLVLVSTVVEKNIDTEEAVAASASEINASIVRLLESLKWKPYQKILLQGSDNDILVKDIKDFGLLVVIAKGGVDMINIDAQANWAAGMIETLNEGN